MLDWFFGLTAQEQWETARNWLATIGGLIALLIAANTYRRNVKNKREEQARLVYSKITFVADHKPGEQFATLLNGATMGSGSLGVVHAREKNPETDRWDLSLAVAPVIQATVIIHNGSKELIQNARVQIIHGVSRELLNAQSMTVAEVEPETNFPIEFLWVNEFDPGHPPLATSLLFQDSSGQWWRRVRSDSIDRVHNDPENLSLPAHERVETRKFQESMGIPKERWVAEPKVGPVARLHRIGRRLRGKNPIP
jgi:hypothetical protein